MTDQPDRLLPRPVSRGRGRPPIDSGRLATVSPTAGPHGSVDVLSEVFRCVRLTGSMLFLIDAAAPWATRAPEAGVFAREVLPGSQHLISYHVITAGVCWAELAGQSPQRMEAGDILVIPHGAAYCLSDPAGTQAGYSDAEAVSFFREMVAGRLPVIVTEDGGTEQRTNLICGFLGCDARPFNPVLAALPPVLHLRPRARESERLRHLIDFALAELRDQRAGSREVLLRLSELMFIATVRAHVDSLPGTGSGWLAGLRDPLVARVLSLLHARPARDWTLNALAGEAATSRSVLADRFVSVIGQPPMRYLAAWRMQLATRLLADQEMKVSAVGHAVGYDSEAAFSRAFTRHVGSSPVAWRAAARLTTALAATPAGQFPG